MNKASYLELKIGMAQAGEQSIQIRFANGSTSARPMKIQLNSQSISESFSFNISGSWTNWDTLSISANFNQGINILRLTSVGSEGGPNIDQFEISGEQEQFFTLGLSVIGDGNILSQPKKGVLFKGQEITLVARPGFSSVFKEWTGDISGNNDTLKFVMDSDKNINAIFEEFDVEIPDPDFSMTGYASTPGNGIATTTGGVNGETIIIETLAQLITWGASRQDNYTAETVIIKGKIEAETTVIISIKRGKDISILGDSKSDDGYAELKNISINIRDYSNVIVRNLKMHEVFYPNDDLTIDHCHHVWVDHCEFYSKIGAGIGVDTYDGLLDIKKGSRNVTVSWCHFHHHMKTVLIGHSDNNGAQDAELQMTFHHNWFSNTNGRNPSLRFGQLHYFNNYLENIDDYGFAVRNGAHAKIENCHFESVKLPIATDKFKGHGFACVSGCIYTGSCSETDNQISEPLECGFWDDQIPYDYSLEDVNTVALSVNAFAGVGKVEIITSTPLISKQDEFQINNIYFNKIENTIDISLTTPKQQEIFISIYTIDGKKVMSESKFCSLENQKINLPICNFYPGLHLVIVESSNYKSTGKVVIH